MLERERDSPFPAQSGSISLVVVVIRRGTERISNLILGFGVRDLRLTRGGGPRSVANSPFGPCLLALFFLLSRTKFTRYSKSLCRKTTKTSYNKIVLQNTTVAKHYLLNGRRRPRDPPKTPESHHTPDHPPRPQRTPETESTGQPKTVEG
jgi:hypothetical protein